MGSKKLKLGIGLDIDQGSNKGFNEEIDNYSNNEVGSHLFGDSVQLHAPLDFYSEVKLGNVVFSAISQKSF